MNANSPRSLAIYAAFIVAGLATLGAIAASYFSVGFVHVGMVIGIGVVVLAVAYFVFYYTVEKFIYRNVKLIYRNMQTRKMDKPEEVVIDMGEDVLEEVSSKVSKWAESKSAEIERLKEEEQFRKEFLGNLSHELKTPVFNIQGYILTLLEGGLEDASINRDYLERAARGVERTTLILEDLDMITQIESGRMDLELKTFDIVRLASDVMKAQEMQAKNRGVTLHFKEEYPEMQVVADKMRIEQVLINLLTNAINYSKEEGDVEVRFYHLPDSIQVEIADNGLGVAERHLPRLFERFYRVDESRSRHAGGTGLGLAIVKHIIDAHNQSINVRSTEGVGSTFSFTLRQA